MYLITSTLISHPLPPLYLVTPEPKSEQHIAYFLIQLEQALISGVRLVQLRVKTLNLEKYEWLIQKALICCRQYNAHLLLNATPEQAIKYDTDGVHLSSERLMLCKNRPLKNNKLVSAACHNDIQLQQAEHLGVDFVTLSPVLQTKTHPDASPLGWSRFKELATQISIPIYALGGMKEDYLSYAKTQGACGIAAISALWPEVTSPK